MSTISILIYTDCNIIITINNYIWYEKMTISDIFSGFVLNHFTCIRYVIQSVLLVSCDAATVSPKSFTLVSTRLFQYLPVIKYSFYKTDPATFRQRAVLVHSTQIKVLKKHSYARKHKSNAVLPPSADKIFSSMQ